MQALRIIFQSYHQFSTNLGLCDHYKSKSKFIIFSHLTSVHTSEAIYNREFNYLRMAYRFEINHFFSLYEFQVASHL